MSSADSHIGLPTITFRSLVLLSLLWSQLALAEHSRHCEADPHERCLVCCALERDVLAPDSLRLSIAPVPSWLTDAIRFACAQSESSAHYNPRASP